MTRSTRLPALMVSDPWPIPPVNCAGAVVELAEARLRPLLGLWWRMDQQWEMKRRVVSHGILYVPIDHQIVVDVGNEQAVLSPGQMAILPEGIAHAARYHKAKPRHFDLMALHLTITDNHGRDLLGRFKKRFVDVPDWPHCLPRLRRLTEYQYAAGEEGLAAAAIGLRALLADLLIAVGGLTVATESDPRIAKCLALIAGDPSGRITIDELARAAGVSSRRLRDVFRSVTGLAPKEHLIRVRITEATRLLADPSMRIKEVASRLGFSSDHEFHACFRRILGMTPSLFRQRLHQETSIVR